MANNILILGANGQLGNDLVKVLKDLETNSRGSTNIYAITRTELDAILDLDNLHEKFDKYNARYIINCITTTQVDQCEINVTNSFIINSSFAYKLANYCQESDITLIHISTDYVFDGKALKPYTEKDHENPINIYGLSKYAGEIAIKNYSLKYFIFRVSSLFGVAGASGKGGNFITLMQKLAHEKEEINVIHDQYTSPTHTLDIAKCIKFFITEQITEYGIYNCTSSSSCSWFDFAREILKCSNLDFNKVKPIAFKDYPFKAKRPQYGVLSLTKLSKFYQMPDYETALMQYFQIKGE